MRVCSPLAVAPNTSYSRKSSLRCCRSIMSHPVAENSKSNGTDWKKLRIICSQSISRFTSRSATSGNDSDESKIVPGLTASSTDSESPCIVSPSGSSFSFEDLGLPVACDDPHYEDDLRSPLTQTFLKPYVDFKKYHDEPEDLTAYISRTDDFPYSCGGFGNVWKCKLTNSFLRNGTKILPRNVAVKAFRVPSRKPEDLNKLIKKLRQEVFVWRQLEHSHIVPLYGTTEKYEIIPALVCPWMKNGSLHQYLGTMRREQSPPEMHRLFLLLLQVILGLQYLHSKDIVHGDLMPPNVLIDENGDALLADFGLSCLLADHETSFFASHSSGATRWAAPEIIPLDTERLDECVSKPNKASDIYSFGCIMMQVLSNCSPYFDMKTESLVVMAKSKGILPTRPASPVIADVHWCYIERCWSTQIEMRPSVDEVLDYIKGEHDKFKQS
ncbi:kinase-like domain-containing protein [Suillus fuscotomentosus]|uniref:Kinase-like domain-containing protein n=1 Tax=Suillus fuscotomentosus TaxID=1912939 RepID=A0AAD4E0Y2_9AGAM|nr:kinase-like domain-containing protein [Suillus fuscotomentosus]KAG1897700.1 kinase-like domain-containing protein [Suillus fuscotomentosus]